MTTTTQEIDAKGWLLIAASTLGVAVCVIPVSILSLGVFIKPLGAEFGWGRGDVTLALTILSLAMAVALPLSGRIIDSFGVKRPVVVSLVLYGGGVAFTPTAIDLWGLHGLYAMAAWVGITGSPSSSVAYVKILSGWFDRSRGLALGFAMSGVALGGALGPFIAASIIAASGWRAGFHGLALLPIVIGLPVALYIREAPAADLARREKSTATLPGMTQREAGRSRIFWVLLLLFLVAATAIHGVQIHLAPLLSDRGLDPRYAALGVTFMFSISVVVRLIAGYLFDRMFAPWVGAVCFFGACVGTAMLVPAAASPMVYLIGVALLGIGAGAESDLLGMLVSRYFGLRSFGTIYGSIFSAFMVGSALGPFLLGVGFDTTGNYATALAWCSGGLALTTLMLIALPRFPVWGARDVAKVPEAEMPLAIAG
jgi:MFS family permease